MTESFAELFEQSQTLNKLKPGSIVTGIVVEIRNDVVVINAGLKSEGIVPIEQFKSENGALEVEVGDEVKVALDALEDGFGETKLSREKAKRSMVWDDLEQAFDKEETITGKISGKVKGGFTVDIKDVRAFLPGSLVDVRPVRDPVYLEGKDLEFKIIKLDRKRNNVVVSRRAVVESEHSEEREQLMEKLQEGAILHGVVKNLTDYGAFVDLGGIDGLLHVTDMSYGRIGHPSEVLHVGDEITVKILKFDRTKERVSLGVKQLEPDPWETVVERYPLNARVIGRVVSLTDYGAFIELEQGVEGLVHVSEMSWTKRVKHPSKLVEVGQQVEAVVLDIDPRAKRISLGMKQIEANPWTLLEDKYPIGSVIRGEVRNVTDFGIFVGVEEGIDGLVHVSDISWTERIKHPGEKFKKGDVVEAAVLNIDVENERFSLGIKQIQPDPWTTLSERHPVGSRVKGKVTKVTDFGAFVEIEPGIEGLVHVSELREERTENPRDVVKEGDEVEVKVIDMDLQERKVALSIKQLNRDGGEDDYREYLRRQGDGRARLGDLMEKFNRRK